MMLQNTEYKTQNTEQQAKIKRFNVLYPISGILIFLTLSGCITTPEMDSMRDSITSIRIESMHKKREIDDIRGKLTEISKEVAKVAILKEHSLGAVQEGQVSLLSQIQKLSKELQILSGRFDENRYFMQRTIREVLSEKELQQAKITSLEKEMENLKMRLDGMRPEMPEREDRADIPQDFAKTTLSEAEAENVYIDDPQRVYDDAQVDFEKALYVESRRGFKKFTKDFPTHALAPNAYFWIGETYYADKMHKDAILAYEDFLRRFSDHEKARSARLKQAYAFIELGDKRTGRIILERIMENHPNSNEAELARKKLAEMSP